jgi:chromosome segregation ATPase
MKTGDALAETKAQVDAARQDALNAQEAAARLGAKLDKARAKGERLANDLGEATAQAILQRQETDAIASQIRAQADELKNLRIQLERTQLQAKAECERGDRLQAELAAAPARIESSTALQARLAAATHEAGERSLREAALSAELDRTRADLKSAQTQGDAITAHVESQRREMKHLAEHLHARLEEIKALKAKLQAAERRAEQRDRLQDGLATVRGQAASLAPVEVDRLQAELQLTRPDTAERERLEADLETARRQTLQARHEVERSREERASPTATNRADTGRADRDQSTLAATQAELAAAQAQIAEQAKALAEIRDELAEKEWQIEQAEGDLIRRGGASPLKTPEVSGNRPGNGGEALPYLQRRRPASAAGDGRLPSQDATPAASPSPAAIAGGGNPLFELSSGPAGAEVRAARSAVNACPRLGNLNDRETHYAFSSPEHRCFALGSPSPIAPSHQNAHCLCEAYAECPVFSGQESSPTLPINADGMAPAGGEHARPRLSRWLAGFVSKSD